ncbi:MAG: hypothetical protein AB7I32_05055 [Gammaproteobacteria bacterium]
MLETRERCVYGYASEAEGIAHARAADVAAGLWQFFAADGRALLPTHSGPDAYRLQPAPDGAARLQDILHELRAVVIDGKRLTAAALRERLPPLGPA